MINDKIEELNTGCAPKSAGIEYEHDIRRKPLSSITKLKNGWKNYPQ